MRVPAKGTGAIGGLHFFQGSGISEDHGGSDMWLDMWTGADGNPATYKSYDVCWVVVIVNSDDDDDDGGVVVVVVCVYVCACVCMCVCSLVALYPGPFFPRRPRWCSRMKRDSNFSAKEWTCS